MFEIIIGKKFKDEESFIWVCRYDMDKQDIVFECDELLAIEDKDTFFLRNTEKVNN